MDTSTVAKRTRDFLNGAEKKGEVETVSYELPKSFAVCSEKRRENKVYLSPLATTTLLKRTENFEG